MTALAAVIKKAAYKHGYLLLIAAWLYTITFVFTNYWSYSSSPQKVKNTLENYVAQQEQLFQTIITDSNYVNAIINKQTNKEDAFLEKQSIGIFAYSRNDLGNPIQIYWNTSQMSADTNDLKKSDGNYVVNYQNGLFELLKRTIVADKKRIIIAGLVPLHWRYFIENQHLHSQFANFSGIDKLYQLTDDRNAVAIKNSNGAVLFHIEPLPAVRAVQPDALSAALRAITILLLLFFFNAIAKEICIQLSFFESFIFLAGVLFLFRLFLYFSNFPFYLNSLELFAQPESDHTIFSASPGGLLLNCILVFQLTSFVFFYRKIPGIVNNKYLRIIAVSFLALYALVTILFCNAVKGLIYNAGVSFEVNNFFSLNVYTLAVLVTLALFILCFYYLSWLFILPSVKAGFSLFERIVYTVASGFLILSFSGNADASVSVKITALLCVSVLMILQHYRRKDKRTTLIKSQFFIVWITFLSLCVSALFVVNKKDFELLQKQNLAIRLAEQIDPYSESVLKIATNGLSQDFLKNNFGRLNDAYENKLIKDSLISTNFSGYLNKYDTHIYTYDNKDAPLYNDDQTPYSTISNIIRKLPLKQKSATIPGLYFLEDKSSDFSYIYNASVTSKDAGLTGRIAVIAKPKSFKKDAIYPELFSQPKSADAAVAGSSFAIYKQRHLINYSNDFSFADSLLPEQIPVLNFEQKKDKDYNELWYKSNNDKVVIIISGNSQFVEFLTLFAVLFCITIFLVLFFEAGAFIVRARFEKKDFKKAVSLNIRSQVQTTIIGISLLSFLVIGFVTVNFFSKQFNKTTEAKLAKSSQVLTNEIQEALRSELMLEDINSIGNNSDLERNILNIADLNNTDVNLYDINGDLKVSTQPYIYNKQILSSKMQPQAYYNLHTLHSVLYTQKEYIKRFAFVSIYKPVKSDDGEIIAYLNIPYLNSQQEVNQEISNLLVTLVNLNAVIFVLAGIVALLLTQRITSSLELIGNKLKALQLGEKNEQIAWQRKDEISVLVNEYNKMVRQLESSAQALARSERAGAWQEMARQVAHEIKNPLTPMKLSIQYLQRAINNDAPNIKELSQRVAETLVEQIDQLAKIAGDFSQFANINLVTPVHFNISELLESLAAFHLAGNGVNIKYIQPKEKYFVYADKSQISRLFTNLIKNAEEASNQDKIAEIKIEQHHINNQLVITISDNGSGIPADKQEHIFEPNFTTKTSGTGLGLAICKSIVEKASGKIWFTTQENFGTAFYIELPVSNNTLIAY